jgi:hypothetical protein
MSELAKALKTAPQDKSKLLGKLVEMLESKNIDINEIGDIKRVKLYQAMSKDSDGEAHIHDLAAIQFSPKWETGPEWPVVKQGPAIKMPTPKAKVKKASTFKTCVVVPDIQIGYYRGRDGTLEPTHDEKALSVALKIIEEVNPDAVICVGDNLDFP